VNIHTNQLRKNKKLLNDVDVLKLAALNNNFSGAEIEDLVRAATDTAINRMINERCQT
jgi:vesicle-fusing ATPase